MQRLLRSAVAAAALCLAVSAANADPSAPTPSSAAAAATPAAAHGASPTAAVPAAQPRKVVSRDDEVVCKREETTGSRLGGKRVCMTRRDWDQQSRDAAEGLSGLR